MKHLPLLAALLSLAVPAFGATVSYGTVTVTSPTAGATVPSPFYLSASDQTCSSVAVTAIGFSLDSSSTTTVVSGTTLNTYVPATLGGHILHVKSWGSGGAACDTDVSINVVEATAAPTTGVVVGPVTVTAPAANAELVSPFRLTAIDAICASVNVVSMGYSLDKSTTTTTFKAQSIETSVAASPGAHTLHVKSWGPNGAACVTNVPITIVPDPATTVPANALVFKAVQWNNTWQASHDSATGSGATTGDMQLVPSPSQSGSARQFTTTYESGAGVRYSDVFGTDTYTTNFLYDGWVFVASPSNGLANLELDINQVVGNGDTMIFAFQCSTYSGMWEFGENSGTPTNSHAQWVQSTQPCNPASWAANTWHHVQISHSRDDAGNITYHSVWLDGVEQDINQTVPGAFTLGWAPVVQTNFQVDGLGTSGSVTLYLDNLNVYAW